MRRSGSQRGAVVPHNSMREYGAIRAARNQPEPVSDPVAAVAACVERYDGHAFFDMNVVTGTKGFPSKAFLRALNGDVFRFHGEDYPLTPLRRAIEELYARLAGSDG